MRECLVVKIGGGAGVDIAGICADIAEIARHRLVVVVHGVSATMDSLCAERRIPVQTLTSPSGHQSRYTTPEVRDVFVEAARRVNTEVVAVLQTAGCSAVGMVEPVVLQGERKQAVRAVVNGRVRMVRDDYSGTISTILSHALQASLAVGYIPVIPPLAESADGLLNVDGDRAAAAIARVLQAQELVILSNVRGLLRQLTDKTSLITNVQGAALDQALSWAEGRMKRKVLGAQEALLGGVARVVIGDGRVAQPVTQALQGEGTVFIQ